MCFGSPVGYSVTSDLTGAVVQYFTVWTLFNTCPPIPNAV